MGQDVTSAERSLTASNTATFLDVVALYKALGDGWQAPQPHVD
ncbi:hypothetical protein [Pseudomonas mosselii]|uniref:BrnA antitoxin family protein n=1 Tax=Pseudomonas mosselii TaxID=78327 RepID=A0AA42RVX6_9PSED|nr:hypothetical protein [Pseudomonas mosselii]MDH1629571.1 BrnA antitoxin family protein [Pseudomonas mosselii]